MTKENSKLFMKLHGIEPQVLPFSPNSLFSFRNNLKMSFNFSLLSQAYLQGHCQFITAINARLEAPSEP